MLEYAPRRPWVRRRWKRVALVALLMGVAAAGWWWRGEIDYAWQRAAYLRAQQRCLQFQAEPDRIAYEENPILAGQLLASDADYLPHIEKASHDGPRTLALWWPKAARDFPDAFNYTPHLGSKALLFLHERTTPGGRRVLVSMFMYVRAGQQTPLLTYETRISDAATWDAPPTLAGGRGSGVVDNVWNYYSTKPVRIYARPSRPHRRLPLHDRLRAWRATRRDRGTRDGCRTRHAAFLR